jgi:hypothetical protein
MNYKYYKKLQNPIRNKEFKMMEWTEEITVQRNFYFPTGCKHIIGLGIPEG